MEKSTEKVCVGVFAGAHGIRGLVKIRSFTVDPNDLFSYNLLYDETFTKTFKPKKKSLNKNLIIAEIEGINDRDKALEGINQLQITVSNLVSILDKLIEKYLNQNMKTNKRL